MISGWGKTVQNRNSYPKLLRKVNKGEEGHPVFSVSNSISHRPLLEYTTEENASAPMEGTGHGQAYAQVGDVLAQA